MRFSKSIFDTFINRQISEIHRVVIHAGTQSYVLPDTAVFITDIGMVQIIVDVHEKQLLRLGSLDDIVISGDYDDRINVELQIWDVPLIPMKIGAVYEVFETGLMTMEDYFVGVFLANDRKEFMIGLIMHLDDLECLSTESMWKYIERLLAGGSRIRVWPANAEV